MCPTTMQIEELHSVCFSLEELMITTDYKLADLSKEVFVRRITSAFDKCSMSSLPDFADGCSSSTKGNET